MSRVTLVYVLTVVVVSIVFDAVMYWRGGWEATISYLVLTRSRRYQVIALAVGILIGHLFWPQPEPRDDEGKPK